VLAILTQRRFRSLSPRTFGGEFGFDNLHNYACDIYRSVRSRFFAS
jgi:hypothetical protein